MGGCLCRLCGGLGCSLRHLSGSLCGLDAFGALLDPLQGSVGCLYCFCRLPLDTLHHSVLGLDFGGRTLGGLSRLGCGFGGGTLGPLANAGHLTFLPHFLGGSLRQLFAAPIGQIRPFLGSALHTGQHLIPGSVGRGIGGLPLLAGEGRFLYLGNGFLLGLQPQILHSGFRGFGRTLQQFGLAAHRFGLYFFQRHTSCKKRIQGAEGGPLGNGRFMDVTPLSGLHPAWWSSAGTGGCCGESCSRRGRCSQRSG